MNHRQACRQQLSNKLERVINYLDWLKKHSVVILIFNIFTPVLTEMCCHNYFFHTPRGFLVLSFKKSKFTGWKCYHLRPFFSSWPEFPSVKFSWLTGRFSEIKAQFHMLKISPKNVEVTENEQRGAVQQRPGPLMKAVPLMLIWLLIHVPMWVLSKQSQR